MVGLQYWLFSQTNQVTVDAFADMPSLMDTCFSSEKAGAFLVGGGVPKNFILQSMLMTPNGFDYAVQLTAQDVIHSFFIPAFRLKQDAVPGMTIVAWFRPTRTGVFDLACAQLCGVGHYRMQAKVYVHSAAEFARWQAAQGAGAPAAPAGEAADTGMGRMAMPHSGGAQ